MSSSRIKVTPKEMRWGIDEEPEIYIPKDLPRRNGLEDVVKYIRAHYPDVNEKRCWRLAFEAIPRRYFFTPHNDSICWREKACYDSLHIWLHRGRMDAPKEKVSFLTKIRKLIGA